MTTVTKSIRVEFGGGLELLFSKQKSHKVDVPTATVEGKPTDMKYLILWLKDHLLTEREELFLDDNTVYVLMHNVDLRTHLLRVSCDLVAC